MAELYTRSSASGLDRALVQEWAAPCTISTRGNSMSKRMPDLLRFVVCSALVVLSSVASAGTIPLKVVGFDDMSCRAWVKSKDDAEQRREYLAWIRGVLTGHNYANPGQQVSAMSTATVENYVDRYCGEKPGGDFGEAALRMSDRFSGRNAAIGK